MNDIDPKRFDLIAALQGRTYPTETVTVFLDEAMMYAYSKAVWDHDHDPQNKEKEALRDSIQKGLESAAIKVTVRGLSPEQRDAIRDEAFEKFPLKKNAFGQEEVPTEALQFIEDTTWAQSVVRIEASDGTFAVPSPDEVKAFQNMAPESSVKAISQAIIALREGSARGYTNAVQEHSFLS